MTAPHKFYQIKMRMRGLYGDYTSSDAANKGNVDMVIKVLHAMKGGSSETRFCNRAAF